MHLFLAMGIISGVIVEYAQKSFIKGLFGGKRLFGLLSIAALSLLIGVCGIIYEFVKLQG